MVTPRNCSSLSWIALVGEGVKVGSKVLVAIGVVEAVAVGVADGKCKGMHAETAEPIRKAVRIIRRI
jgi:hypothetical protein